jgi:nitrogen-specific signal transduction histidine kinase
LAAIREAARGIAHDFNNLLAAIKGNADLLLMELPAGDPLYEDAEEIVRAVDRAAPLIERLLALGRGAHQTQDDG